MKKLESSLLNMVVVLTVVAAVAAGLLAWVNHVTEGPISLQAQKTLADGIKAVMGCDDITVAAPDSITKDYDGKKSTYVVYAVKDNGGNELGKAVESTVMAFGGEMKVLVGFNRDNVILGYRVLESAETPGLGQKADTWFQKSGKGCIVGRRMSSDAPLKVNKDNGDVDAITASTITSRAFLKAVSRAFDAYINESDGATGASSRLMVQQVRAPKLMDRQVRVLRLMARQMLTLKKRRSRQMANRLIKSVQISNRIQS